MKRKFGFFDIFRKNDAEIQYQFAMQNLQNGAYEEAVRLLLLSANQGFPLAQLELADCYADGYDSEMAYADEGKALDATLSPGKKTKGIVCFEVPKNFKDISLEYETNYWSESKVCFEVKK
jgi:TPR repeat protein